LVISAPGYARNSANKPVSMVGRTWDPPPDAEKPKWIQPSRNMGCDPGKPTDPESVSKVAVVDWGEGRVRERSVDSLAI